MASLSCGHDCGTFYLSTDTIGPDDGFGFGHVALALIPHLLQLHSPVTCIDSRAQWLARILENPKLPPSMFVVLTSRGHATDLPVLAEILQTGSAPSIGVIGSKQKASVLEREFAAMGPREENLAPYYCPIGLPIGNDTLSEIAISVVA